MNGIDEITVRKVTRENWRESLQLAVRPDQQRFVSEYAPIAAIALAKAYIRPGGAIWTPYAIYANSTMVGFAALAYEPGTTDEYWIFHFFIDQRYQGRGYGRAALRRFVAMVKREHPECLTLQLVVHPKNLPAQRFYTAAGFRPTGAERWGEPVYQYSLAPQQ
ncbi:MAG TPA: GNAT family N-acetyltransferase [Ktedonobacterales bacterium]